MSKKNFINFDLKPTSDPNAFTLTDDVNGVDPSILGTTAVQSQTCTADYIVIPSPRQVTNGVVVALASDRFCGLGIGNIVSKLNLTFEVSSVAKTQNRSRSNSAICRSSCD